MSVYKRKSGRWAALVDAEDPEPYRIVELRPTPSGRRHTKILARFRSLPEAEKQLIGLVASGDSRTLSVEQLARGRRALGTFKTKKEAEQAERAVLEAKDRGIDISPSMVTVADLADRYVRNRRALERCGIKTVEEYDRVIRLYIEPHFRGALVKKLRPVAVSEWVVTLMQRGGRGGKPISAKTAKHAFALLSSSLRWGVKMQLVGHNVCDVSEPPTPARSEARALSNGEVAKLMLAAKGSRWEFFVDLALMLGARRGELLAVTWDDIDLEAGTVVIRASLSQTKDAIAVKSTKSGRVRAIPLTTEARDAFRGQRSQQNEDRLRNGDVYQVDPRRPVFTNEIGVQLTPKAATNAFARIARKAQIGTTSLHSTRHTAATQLIAAGIDVTTTASILGHTTPNITLALYSHVIEGAERVAMDVLGARLEKMRVHQSAIEQDPNGNRMATAALTAKKKARVTGLLMVAGVQVHQRILDHLPIFARKSWITNPGGLDQNDLARIGFG
jgi:integrase